MNAVKKTLTALAAGAALGFGALPAVALLAEPVTAAALPSDPPDGCEIPANADTCEGPVRPDGSRRRCNYAPSYTTGGTLIPQIKTCQLIHP